MPYKSRNKISALNKQKGCKKRTIKKPTSFCSLMPVGTAKVCFHTDDPIQTKPANSRQALMRMN